VTHGAGAAQDDTTITVVHVSDLFFDVPDFALEPEALWTKFSELSFGRDIDFADYPVFSGKYYLRGDDEQAVCQFFTGELIQFLQTHDPVHIESHRGKLLVYTKRGEAETSEVESLVEFVESFLAAVKNEKQHV
jgi:hypothetical protein